MEGKIKLQSEGIIKQFTQPAGFLRKNMIYRGQSLRLIKIILFSVLICLSFLSLSLDAYAADRYWVCTASDYWTNSSCWSTTSGGGGGASVPGASDTAIFDQNPGKKNCSLTANTTVGALDMQSTNSVTITTTSSDWDFTAIGDFTVNGEVFDANDSTVTVGGNMDLTGGTFASDGNSLMVFDGTTSLTSAGTTFDNVQVGTGASGGSLTILDQADIDGSFSILNGGATTLDLTSQTLLLESSSIDLTNLDTFTVTGSTVTLDGGTNVTITSDGMSFNNLTL
ncbi:MAG: hypothetical protein KAQ85_05985, partial [Thermodesulfovibrionia bacterium]|nr:hypothetical protein [Thermodesulfovibrionia bacterium]